MKLFIDKNRIKQLRNYTSFIHTQNIYNLNKEAIDISFNVPSNNYLIVRKNFTMTINSNAFIMNYGTIINYGTIRATKHY